MSVIPFKPLVSIKNDNELEAYVQERIADALSIISELKISAARRTWTDREDSVIDDYAGGNVDDAYDGGLRDGETYLARELLDKLGVEYDE